MGKKYSDGSLASASPLDGTERWGASRSGADKYITAAMLATYIGGGGGSNAGLVAVCRLSSNLTLLDDGSSHVINFDTEDYDPDSTVTTGASWTLTAPATAWYELTFIRGAVASNGNNFVSGDTMTIYFTKNGSDQDYIAIYTERTTTTIAMRLAGSRVISLTAGDTIQVLYNNGSNAARLLVAAATIEIYRIT